MEIVQELGSVANEITIPVDVKLKRKSEQEKTNGWESVTLNDMTQSQQLGWPLAQKLALPKKDMTQKTVTGWVCNKERADC